MMTYVHELYLYSGFFLDRLSMQAQEIFVQRFEFLLYKKKTSSNTYTYQKYSQVVFKLVFGIVIIA